MATKEYRVKFDGAWTDPDTKKSRTVKKGEVVDLTDEQFAANRDRFELTPVKPAAKPSGDSA